MVPNKGYMRVMEIDKINPNGHRSTYHVVLGPAEDFLSLPLTIDGAKIVDSNGRLRVFHTVGELMEMAERKRHEPLDDGTIEHYETVDEFSEEIYDAYEESVRRQRAVSTVGPHARVQR